MGYGEILDLQAITMRHGDEIKAAIDRVVESGWFYREMKINGLRWTMQIYRYRVLCNCSKWFGCIKTYIAWL